MARMITGYLHVQVLFGVMLALHQATFASGNDTRRSSDLGTGDTAASSEWTTTVCMGVESHKSSYSHAFAP
mgnify:CR=1 FL=1